MKEYSDSKITGIVFISLVTLSIFVITIMMLYIYYFTVKKSPRMSSWIVRLNKGGEVIPQHVLIFVMQFVLLIIGLSLITV
jgi:hypothetical protein